MIAIADQVSRRFVPRERFAELLSGPYRRWMRGDRDADDTSAIVRQDHQDEQQAVRRRRDHKEINGHQLSHVVRQERAPRLRRWPPMADHVFRDAGLTDVNPEFQEFAVDARRAPQRIGPRHRANQRADVEWHGRSTHPAPTLPRPEHAEASAMRSDDRLGSDDDERRSPVLPHTRDPHPEQAVGSRETQPPRTGPLQHVELVAQCEHLELQRGARAHTTSYGQQQRDEDGHHRREAYPQTAGTSTLATRTEFQQTQPVPGWTTCIPVRHCKVSTAVCVHHLVQGTP